MGIFDFLKDVFTLDSFYTAPEIDAPTRLAKNALAEHDGSNPNDPGQTRATMPAVSGIGHDVTAGPRDIRADLPNLKDVPKVPPLPGEAGYTEARQAAEEAQGRKPDRFAGVRPLVASTARVLGGLARDKQTLLPVRGPGSDALPLSSRQ